MTKRIFAFVMSVFMLGVVCCMPLKVHAEEKITVTEKKSVMYSVPGTSVYNYPDFNSNVVTSIQANLPVEVLGVTSNGWFQVNLNGKYYVPSNGLTNTKPATTAVVNAYDEASVRKLIRGTFSYYTGAELRDFTSTDVDTMDENEYIKYMDSYLYGNASIEKCIIKESGLSLKEHYAGKLQADPNLANKPMREYFIEYRNKYLVDSMKGPAKTKKGLVKIINRSIRYDLFDFTTIYKNTTVGNNEKEMTEVLKEVVEQVKEEQGIAFTYKISYGNYVTSSGANASGWHISFSRAK